MKNKTGGDRRLSETDEEATVIEDQVRPGMLHFLLLVLSNSFVIIAVKECMKFRYQCMLDIQIS